MEYIRGNNVVRNVPLLRRLASRVKQGTSVSKVLEDIFEDSSRGFSVCTICAQRIAKGSAVERHRVTHMIQVAKVAVSMKSDEKSPLTD